jgi:SdpI/YfhL protein family
VDSIRFQALLLAGVFAVTLAAISATMIANWSRAARGELQRNPHLGVRTPSTLRSEQSWMAGNRAALRLVPLFVLFNAVTSAALVAIALNGWRLVVILTGSGGLVAFIGLCICAAVIASRAARAADDQTELHDTASHSTKTPGSAKPFSDPTATAAGWLVTVTVCAATTFLLATVIGGYVLAIHHQLHPHGGFGFRDASTRRCLAAWNASQRAGFSWLLFGYGPLWALSILFAVVAAIKRRPPWRVSAVVASTLFLFIVAVIIAGLHADSVARAVTC